MDDLNKRALDLAGIAPNQDTEITDGICEWCGDKGDVFKDNSLCNDCDSNTIHCRVCETLIHCDDRCRHVFQDSNFEWTGAGGYEPTDEVRAAFFKLLDLMPDGFAVDLRAAIEAERFHTWFIAPLIGSGGLLELHGMPKRAGKHMVHRWGDAMIKIGEGDHAEETADGYRWLASLYDDRTPAANTKTIAWIDEFLSVSGGPS